MLIPPKIIGKVVGVGLCAAPYVMLSNTGKEVETNLLKLGTETCPYTNWSGNLNHIKRHCIPVIRYKDGG
jgi:hypothetical protein